MTASTITTRGRDLAAKFTQKGWFVADHDKLEHDCSLIARHAVTLHRLYEDKCNGHPANSDPRFPIKQAGVLQEQWQARIDRTEERLRQRIAELAKGLPNVDCVVFNGDPRGAPVRLVTKDGSGDSWADPRGWCV